jgi:hypothetical protein
MLLSYVLTGHALQIHIHLRFDAMHFYVLISWPPQSVHMWQVPLCTLTVIGPEINTEIDAMSVRYVFFSFYAFCPLVFFSHNQLFLYFYVLLHDFLVLIPHVLFFAFYF